MSRPETRWRRRLAWFAAELTVVVSGVLIALAINGWAGARADEAQAYAYLRQLDADLDETFRFLDVLDEGMLPYEANNRKAIRAFRTLDRPPEDSLYTWIWGHAVAPVFPVTSAVDALEATGDLHLIRSDSLQLRISSYAADVENTLAFQRTHVEAYNEAKIRLSDHVDVIEMRARIRPQAETDSADAEPGVALVPAGPRRSPFPFDPEAVLSDREVYNALVAMREAMSSLRTIRGHFRGYAEDLQAAIDTHEASR